MSELRSCPFCKEQLHKMSEAQGYFHSKGNWNCALSGFEMENSIYAETRWNSRPVEQELVEALEAARGFAAEWIYEHGGIDGCDMSDRLAFERIEAVIAKARGETP